MKPRNRLIAGLAAFTLVLLGAVTAVAYTGQVAASITISVDVPCGESAPATATILDASGAPVANQAVTWSFDESPSASDTISPTSSTTDANGVATTTVTVAAVAGARTIRATAGDVSATAVFEPPCAGVLPNTSTAPADGPTVPFGAIAAMVVVFVLGSALTLRRLAAARR